MKKRTTITVEMWEGTVIRRQAPTNLRCRCCGGAADAAACETHPITPTERVICSLCRDVQPTGERDHEKNS